MKSGTARTPLIAIVDDDASFREAMTDLLHYSGFDVAAFTSAAAVLRSKALPTIDAFLLDVQMPKMSGLELLDALNALRPVRPVMFVTSCNDDATREQAIKRGALALFGKPFDSNALIALLHRALEQP